MYSHVERLSALFSPWYLWQPAGQYMIVPGEDTTEAGVGGSLLSDTNPPLHRVKWKYMQDPRWVQAGVVAPGELYREAS